MIKLLKIPKINNKRYTPEYGDILYGDEYIAGKVELKDIKHPILLSNFGNNTWETLKKFEIDYEMLQKRVTYECYMTGNKYYWFLPMMILCGYSTKAYRGLSSFSDPYFNMLFDEEWTLQFLEGYSVENINKIQQSLLGHGYTLGTLPSDGSNSIEVVWVEMSNGDKLVGFCWIWHNK